MNLKLLLFMFSLPLASAVNNTNVGQLNSLNVDEKARELVVVKQKKLIEHTALHWLEQHKPSHWEIESVQALDIGPVSETICQFSLTDNKRTEDKPVLKSRVRLAFELITCDDQKITQKIWFKVSAKKSIARANKDIQKFQPVTREDLDESKVDAFKRSYQKALGDFGVALRAVEDINYGEVILSHMVSAKHDITAGDSVVIYMQVDAMRIERKGTAMNSANIGESIELKLLDSKKTLTAKVKTQGIAIYE